MVLNTAALTAARPGVKGRERVRNQELVRGGSFKAQPGGVAAWLRAGEPTPHSGRAQISAGFMDEN